MWEYEQVCKSCGVLHMNLQEVSDWRLLNTGICEYCHEFLTIKNDVIARVAKQKNWEGRNNEGNIVVEEVKPNKVVYHYSTKPDVSYEESFKWFLSYFQEKPVVSETVEAVLPSEAFDEAWQEGYDSGIAHAKVGEQLKEDYEREKKWAEEAAKSIKVRDLYFKDHEVVIVVKVNSEQVSYRDWNTESLGRCSPIEFASTFEKLPEIGTVWTNKKFPSVEVVVTESNVPTHTCIDVIKNNQASTIKGQYSNRNFIAQFEPKKITESEVTLIGIAGLARSGKDTVADYLSRCLGGDWSRMALADPIKAMLEAIGVDCSDEGKAQEVNAIGFDTRGLMQSLGTTWGRDLVDEDIWLNILLNKAKGKKVIVSDIRFENEADAIREAGGIIIHVEGKGGLKGSNGEHKSEKRIDVLGDDLKVYNHGDFRDLYRQLDLLIWGLKNAK